MSKDQLYHLALASLTAPNAVLVSRTTWSQSRSTSQQMLIALTKASEAAYNLWMLDFPDSTSVPTRGMARQKVQSVDAHWTNNPVSPMRPAMLDPSSRAMAIATLWHTLTLQVVCGWKGQIR